MTDPQTTPIRRRRNPVRWREDMGEERLWVCQACDAHLDADSVGETCRPVEKRLMTKPETTRRRRFYTEAWRKYPGVGWIASPRSNLGGGIFRIEPWHHHRRFRRPLQRKFV